VSPEKFKKSKNQTSLLAPLLSAKAQANFASTGAPAAELTACALDAVPASTRLAMPCKMAASLNRL
jgi:hypothetical protein